MDPLIINLILIVLAILIAYVLYKALKTTKKLAVNIILGFIILFIAYFLGLYHFPTGSLFSMIATVIITALTGVFGALVLIILSIFGLSF